MNTKTRTLLLFMATALAPLWSQATIWRVNSTPGFSSYPGTLQQCILDPNVDDGDTLHVESSAVGYGAIVCNRPLVFIGPGYRIGNTANDNTDLQHHQLTATLTSLELQNSAIGTRVYGLRFTGILEVNCSDVTIQGNLFDTNGRLRFAGSPNTFTDILIRNNYFDSAFGIEKFGSTQTYSSVEIVNNIFVTTRIDLDGGQVTSMTIANNVFYATSGGNLNWCAVTGAEIKDNIFYLTATNSSISQTNDIHHNLAANVTLLPSGNNNVNGVDMTNVFTLVGSDDKRWELLPGVSNTYPASDATERGIYGGNEPYRLSGIPPVPSIYFLQPTGPASVGFPLPVIISTRSNN